MMALAPDQARAAPARPRRSLLRTTTAAVACAAVLLPVAGPALAQGLPLIRDAEIENLLKDYSRPIFRAAGLGSQNITMRIIRHESFNAFVVDGQNVFINSGTLAEAKTPNEVIGVIAHETGHIKGGHMAQLRARIARDQTKSLLLTILGIGLMVGGATAGSDGARSIGSAGQGVMMGGNEMLMRSLLSERRNQESAADQAGLTFLGLTHQSGRGMLETFERFARQEYISDAQKDPFVRSHPVAADRLARLREKVEASPYYSAKDPPQLQLRHDMMRAKLAGYLDRPQVVYNRYPPSDTSLPARYARAIARNCSGNCATAIGDVDALIREQPGNAYFWELKGNMLYANGKYADAIPALRKSLQIAGREPLIEVALAQALLGMNTAGGVDEALGLLRRAVVSDPSNSLAYHQMANAFYKKQQYPQADLAAAQAHFIEGNVKQAQIFAKRALTKLSRGSPEWLRAEDIVNYKAPT
ncbi:MAG: M48 family metalloprotease [Hyphomicrobiaceae bacterium]